MRSIILALAAGVALGASSYTHAQATKGLPFIVDPVTGDTIVARPK